MRVRPLLFYPWMVRLAVPRVTAGVYILGERDDQQFRPRYVGRSDADLQDRLSRHELRSALPYFQFRTCRDPYQAFLRECYYYHLHVEGLLNRIHPDAPNGSEFSCPYCATARAFSERTAGRYNWQMRQGSVSSSSSRASLKI